MDRDSVFVENAEDVCVWWDGLCSMFFPASSASGDAAVGNADAELGVLLSAFEERFVLGLNGKRDSNVGERTWFPVFTFVDIAGICAACVSLGKSVSCVAVVVVRLARVNRGVSLPVVLCCS